MSCRSLLDQVDGVLTISSLGTSAAAIVLSYLSCYIVPDASDETNGTDFAWGISGFISFLPFFNWLAWILPALQSNRSVIYYSYAALYFYPLARNGFDLDWYSLVMLLACITHVQVERIARTEPEVLQEATPFTSVGGALAKTLKAVGAFSGELATAVQDDARRIGEGKSAVDFDRQLRQEIDETRETAGQQLDEFDKKLRRKNFL